MRRSHERFNRIISSGATGVTAWRCYSQTVLLAANAPVGLTQSMVTVADVERDVSPAIDAYRPQTEWASRVFKVLFTVDNGITYTYMTLQEMTIDIANRTLSISQTISYEPSRFVQAMT